MLTLQFRDKYQRCICKQSLFSLSFERMLFQERMLPIVIKKSEEGTSCSIVCNYLHCNYKLCRLIPNLINLALKIENKMLCKICTYVRSTVTKRRRGIVGDICKSLLLLFWMLLSPFVSIQE